MGTASLDGVYRSEIVNTKPASPRLARRTPVTRQHRTTIGHRFDGHAAQRLAPQRRNQDGAAHRVEVAGLGNWPSGLDGRIMAFTSSKCATIAPGHASGGVKIAADRGEVEACFHECLKLPVISVGSYARNPVTKHMTTGRETVVRTGRIQPRASARSPSRHAAGAKALQPWPSARPRCSRVALTCEVGGDPVRITGSRPVVTSLTMDHGLGKRGHHHGHRAHRDHTRECVARTGRKPSSLGRQPDPGPCPAEADRRQYTPAQSIGRIGSLIPRWARKSWTACRQPATLP